MTLSVPFITPGCQLGQGHLIMLIEEEILSKINRKKKNCEQNAISCYEADLPQTKSFTHGDISSNKKYILSWPRAPSFFVYKGVLQFRPTVQILSQHKDFLLLPVIFTPINLCNCDPSFPSRYPCAGCSPDSRVQHVPFSSSCQRPQHSALVPAACLSESWATTAGTRKLMEPLSSAHKLTSLSIWTLTAKRNLQCQQKH